MRNREKLIESDVLPTTSQGTPDAFMKEYEKAKQAGESAVVTLMYYLRKGKLYIMGGAFVALDAFMLLVEFLMGVTFHLRFIGWAIYPLTALSLFGGFLIYLAINRSAREMMERKLFF